MVFAKSSCNGPELPLQVVQPKPTTLNPNSSKYFCKPDCSKISAVTLLPGAKEVLTFLFLLKPSSINFFAIKPAAITFFGFAVFVQLVIAAIIISASLILKPRFGTSNKSSLKSFLYSICE